MKSTTGQLLRNSQSADRSHLSKAVDEQKKKFLALAQAFYDGSERTEAQALELTEAILEAIDNILKVEDWDSSLFLRSTIKPIRELREEVIATRNTLKEQQGLIEIAEYQLLDDETKVYVSLYQSDGHSLVKWEGQLASIDCYMAGRPIYKNEADIKKTIRQKLLQMSEAYAVVVVKKSAVMDQGFEAPKTDRYGHELLTLEQGILSSDKVIEFVHGGRAYHYRKQKLVLKNFPDN